MNKDNLKYIMVVVAGCGLIGSCLGIMVNISGVFFTPLAAEFNVGRGVVSLTVTIYNITQAITGMIAPRQVNKFGLRKMVIFGTFLQVGATLLISFSNSINMIYLMNMIRGIGSGLIGTVTVTIMLNYWFNKNNALITSIAMGFSGIISAVLSPTITTFIVNYGWRFSYQLTAMIILVLNLPATILPIALRPEKISFKPFGERKEVITRSEESDTEVSVSMLTILLIYTVCVSSVTALPQHFPGIAESYNLISVGAIMLSIGMIMNTVGKILLGFLIDKIGARISVSMYTIGVIASLSALYMFRVPFVMQVSAALIGLAYALATVAAAMITREMFGSKNYSKVYPKVALGTTFSNAVLTSVVGYLYDFFGSYDVTLYLSIGLMLLAFGLIQYAYIKNQKV